MYTLYGIKNCDTVKKTKTWLDQHQIQYQFHDYRSDGLDAQLLSQFESELGWEQLLNRRSTTWRQLTEHQKQNMDKTLALQLMLEQPTLIKRPILDTGNRLLIGFSARQYQSEL